MSRAESRCKRLIGDIMNFKVRQFNSEKPQGAGIR